MPTKHSDHLMPTVCGLEHKFFPVMQKAVIVVRLEQLARGLAWHTGIELVPDAESKQSIMSLRVVAETN